MPVGERSRPRRLGPMLAAVVLLSTLVALSALDVAPRALVWEQAHRLLAALIGLVVSFRSWQVARDRVRAVRGWIALGFVIWAGAEGLRLGSLATPDSPLLTLSTVLAACVTVGAAGAYVANLRGKLSDREQLAVYLEAATVCAAITGVLIALVGERALAQPASLPPLIQGALFLNILGATLILDLAVRAELRLRGAYVILLGLALVGGGFVGSSVIAAGTSIAGGTWMFGALISAGVLVVAAGTATWTDREDDRSGYMQVGQGVRGLLPLTTVALSPLLLFEAQDDVGHTLVRLALNLVVGAMMVTAIARQTVLLSERGMVVRSLRNALAYAERRTQQIAGVGRAGRILARAGPTDRALKAIVDLLHERFGYEHVAVYTSDGVDLRRGASRGFADPDGAFDGAGGIVGRVVRTRRPELVPDVRSDPDYRLGAPGVRSEICVPLIADGEFLGILDVESTADIPLDDTDLAAVVAVADQLAGAIALGTERLRLVQEKDFTSAVLDTVGALVIVCDPDDRIVRYNQACADTSGYTMAELATHPSFDFLVPPEAVDLVRTARQDLLHGRSTAIENDWVCRDGSRRRISWSNTAVLDEVGALRYSIASGVDITERQRLAEQLAHRALHDPLTGLANRTLLMDRVAHALMPSRKANLIALLFLDLDDFKAVNDTLGHVVGDRVLIEVGARLQAVLRARDTAARIGGDEFAVLLEDLDDVEGARIVADRIAVALTEPLRLESGDLHVTASVGIATSLDELGGAEDLLRNADLAMYWDKSHGSGHSTVFEPAMFETAVARRDLEQGLWRALELDQFVVLFQPVVDLATGQHVGAEALVRWQHPERGLLGPCEFVTLAEETGQIIQIGQFVLEESCRRAAAWRLASDAPGWVSVNLSGRQFQDERLVEAIERALRASGLPPERLVLELTESNLMHDTPQTMDQLHRINGLGVRIAIDDFGTGYSSLSYLRQFPVDILKIDGSFVETIAIDPTQTAFVSAIVALGESLDLEMIAEGIETGDQARALRGIGCKTGQGYFYARPMPVSELDQCVSSAAVPAGAGLPR